MYNKLKWAQELMDGGGASGNQFRKNLWTDSLNTTRVDGVDLNNDGIADIVPDDILPCLITDEHPLATSGLMKPYHIQPCTRHNAACDKSASNEVAITFRTELGNLPAITPHYAENRGIGFISVSTKGKSLSVKGTKQGTECSGRGICDRETGQCKCFPGYGSSDGRSGKGIRGDCGHKEPTAPKVA